MTLAQRNYIQARGKGRMVIGHPATYKHAVTQLKVSVAWDIAQVEAINRRVVRNNSTFARECRRLMDIALRLDYQAMKHAQQE